MSKVLYIAIALLLTVSATLVLVKARDSQRLTIHVKTPPAQSHARRERLSNFDAKIVECE